MARRGFPLEIVLPLCGLALLVAAIHYHDPPAWDVSVLLWLHRYSSPAGERFMRRVSALGGWFGVVPFSLLVVGWLLWRRRVQPGLFFALSMLGVRPLEYAGKVVLARNRPSLWPSRAAEHWFGFPSGHALAAMALATALGVLAWPTRARWWVVGFGSCFVLLVSTARLYLGMHYPTDVLGGWLAALAWVMVLRRFVLAERGTTRGPARAPGQIA